MSGSRPTCPSLRQSPKGTPSTNGSDRLCAPQPCVTCPCQGGMQCLGCQAIMNVADGDVSRASRPLDAWRRVAPFGDDHMRFKALLGLLSAAAISVVMASGAQ